MANVPSGYVYHDVSTGKYIDPGNAMPTPGEEDFLYPYPANAALFSYTFHTAHNEPYTWADSDIGMTTVALSAGWTVENTEKNNNSTGTTMLSSINGYNIVCVKLFASDCTQMTVPSGCQFFSIPNGKLTKINGSIPASLKYFYCYNCKNLVSVPSLSPATQITNGTGMFCECTKLTTVPALPPNVVTLHEAFEGCTSLTTAPAIPSKVIYGGNLFYGCTKLTTTPVNNSTVISRMFNMFQGCTSLTSAKNFNIPNTMFYGYNMFYGCSKLVTPPDIVRTANDERSDVSEMFSGCTSLKTAPKFIGKFRVGYRMFEGCSSLVDPPDFSEATFTNLSTTFYKCTSLKTPPIIKHIQNCEMGWMFAECTSLETVPILPKNALSLYYCFYKCTSLTWVSMCMPTEKVPNCNYMFTGCINLTGIIYVHGSQNLSHNQIFTDTTKTIILCGLDGADFLSTWAATANHNNVYVGLFAVVEGVSAVRTNESGILDDKGDYVKITVNFTAPVIDYTKLYVPKIYIGNAQQQPLKNWTLTYTENNQTITTEIPNSTSIEATRIEAGNLISAGTFTTLIAAGEENVYDVRIPTSCSQCAIDFDTNNDLIIQTRYWNSRAGSAVFTGSTYIFDALQDGTAFKIGGPVVTEDGDTGFIVGNKIEVVEDQYPSTFNGPTTINSISTFNEKATFNNDLTLYIDTNNGDISSLDYRITTALTDLNWI